MIKVIISLLNFLGIWFCLYFLWYKIVIPWKYRDYRTITALSLGLRPRESGQLSTIILQYHGITITLVAIAFFMRSCHTLCKLVGMILIKYIFTLKGIKVDTLYISWKKLCAIPYHILIHSTKKKELKLFYLKHTSIVLQQYLDTTRSLSCRCWSLVRQDMK